MFGIRNIWRCVALAAFCAVVAPVPAAQARPTESVGITAPRLTVTVSPGLNFATFSIRTSVPSRVVVSYGTDRGNMVPWTIRPLKPRHSFKLSPLAPATRYFYSVIATDAKGKAYPKTGVFNTGPVRPATLSVVNGRFRLNGVPFFPVMAAAYSECPDSKLVAANRALGVNVLDHWRLSYCKSFADGLWATVQELHDRLQGRAFWLSRTNRSHPSPHAPPAPSLEGLEELLSFRGNIDMDLTAGSLWGCAESDSSLTEIYPILKASALRSGVNERALVSLFYLLPEQVPGGRKGCLSAQRFTGQFWAAVFARVAGVEYENQYTTRPDLGVQVAPGVGVQAALEHRKLKTLYPVVLSGKNQTVTSSIRSIAVQAMNWGGNTYVLSLNLEGSMATATLRMPGLGRATARGYWGVRSKTVKGGVIESIWQPYQLQVYRITP